MTKRTPISASIRRYLRGYRECSVPLPISETLCRTFGLQSPALVIEAAGVGRRERLRRLRGLRIGRTPGRPQQQRPRLDVLLAKQVHCIQQAFRIAVRSGHEVVETATAGDLELRIPKLRTGSFFPSLLERRRRVDQALFAVVMEAYLHGVSTRKVDDLVKALGADTGISKSEVSRICAELDAEVGAFRDHSLAAAAFPCVFLDATYCKARVDRRVVSQAVVMATGVRADGWREVLGFAVGDSEDGAFWTAFLRSLKARGLGGVQLVISDAHTGLKAAIAGVLLGASWQRCRVHFLRNVLAAVAPADHGHASGEVDVGQFQRGHLPGQHPGLQHQPDQGVIALVPQVAAPAGRRIPAGHGGQE
jgi:Transposase, Mutator family